MRGHDAQYRLDVDFLDAVNGTKTRITLPDGGTLDVTIPPGVTDGQVLRLKGKGNPGMLLCGEDNLRQVVMFPMNQQAEDLLMGAPSQVAPKQLKELHIRVVPPPKG